MDKRAFSERGICTKFITPALLKAGWDSDTQIREEVGSPRAASSCGASWSVVSRANARSSSILWRAPGPASYNSSSAELISGTITTNLPPLRLALNSSSAKLHPASDRLLVSLRLALNSPSAKLQPLGHPHAALLRLVLNSPLAKGFLCGIASIGT